MKVSEIIQNEANNAKDILLLKEGIFWRAYNQSAIRLCNKIRSYKVNCKYIKKENTTIYYCGFPPQAFAKVKAKVLEKGYSINEHDE